MGRGRRVTPVRDEIVIDLSVGIQLGTNRHNVDLALLLREIAISIMPIIPFTV